MVTSGPYGALWALRAELDAEPPLAVAERAELFAAIGAKVRAIYAAEVRAVAEQAAVVRDG